MIRLPLSHNVERRHDVKGVRWKKKENKERQWSVTRVIVGALPSWALCETAYVACS
jgi:hypothetical protein